MRADLAEELPPEIQPSGHGRRSWVWQVVREGRQAKVGLGILLFFIVLAVLASWIAPYDVHTRVGPVYAAPSLTGYEGGNPGLGLPRSNTNQ